MNMNHAQSFSHIKTIDVYKAFTASFYSYHDEHTALVLFGSRKSRDFAFFLYTYMSRAINIKCHRCNSYRIWKLIIKFLLNIFMYDVYSRSSG